MLKSIECEYYKYGGKNGTPRGKIVFRNGLNTILGGENGENSIGKSMILLAIDYAFGGNTYSRQEFDTSLKEHELKIEFEFKELHYHYIRGLNNPNKVWICDEHFKKISEIKLEEYKNLLLRHYLINLPGLSLRELLGGHFRIYGMDNCNERNPLKNSLHESNADTVNNLLKLFNYYEIVKECEDEYNKKSLEKSTLKQAREFDIVSGEVTSKKDYEQNKQKIAESEICLQEMLNGVDSNITQQYLLNTANMGVLETDLRSLRRKRSWLINKLSIINDNINGIFIMDEIDLEDLLEYFPNANIRKIKEIEQFHKKLQSLLGKQMEMEAVDITKAISDIEIQIKAIEDEQHSLGKTIVVSKDLLEKYNKIKKEIAILEKQNEIYHYNETLKEEVNRLKEAMDAAQKEALTTVMDSLNNQMAAFSDYIYEGSHNFPVLELNGSSKYKFSTINDTGMGTSFKSMIIFDLSILKLTKLPAIANDTLIFKNIEDGHFQKILELYDSFACEKKQIFIACDKKSSYNKDVQKILDNSTVLQLNANGNELFGYSWSKKQSDEK